MMSDMRSRPNNARRVLKAAGLVLDVARRELTRGSKTQRLTPKECRLLALFMSNPGKVLSRRLLMREVWETDFLDDTRTLDVHICYLRKKIEEDPHHPRLLCTVRGVGYRFG